MDEDKPTGASFLPFQVDGIYADACRGQSGSVTVVGPRAQDLVTALLAQQGPVKSQPVTMTLGGYPATRIDLRSPPRLDTRSCFLGRGVGAQIWQNPEGRYLVLMPDGLLSVYVVDVRGKRQVFTTQYDPTGISATDLAALVQMMASIRIKP
jgi:hypothetical protein